MNLKTTLQFSVLCLLQRFDIKSDDLLVRKLMSFYYSKGNGWIGLCHGLKGVIKHEYKVSEGNIKSLCTFLMS